MAYFWQLLKTYGTITLPTKGSPWLGDSTNGGRMATSHQDPTGDNEPGLLKEATGKRTLEATLETSCG